MCKIKGVNTEGYEEVLRKQEHHLNWALKVLMVLDLKFSRVLTNIKVAYSKYKSIISIYEHLCANTWNAKDFTPKYI